MLRHGRSYWVMQREADLRDEQEVPDGFDPPNPLLL